MKQAKLFTTAGDDASFEPSPLAATLSPAAPRELTAADMKRLRASTAPGASFSPCQRYRWILWRRWGSIGDPMLMVIGLNPSTADETIDDPTIRRCISYAMRWNYGGLFMANLFAYRSTDPRRLDRLAEKVEPASCRGLHDRLLVQYADQSDLIVAAWGSDKNVGDRGRQVCQLLARPIHCLKRNDDGSPGHPLYLKKDLTPQLYYSPEHAAHE